MPYRNDQLVGCLPDDMQDDLDDLIVDSNQQQSLLFNPLVINNNDQFIVDSQLKSTNNSNQFQVVQNTDFNSQKNSQCLVNTQNNQNNFLNFHLGQLPTTSFSSNLDLFDIDDELESNHLKDLENLMDTTQITISSLDNVSQQSQQLDGQQKLNLQQLSPQQLSPQQLSPQQLSPQQISRKQLSSQKSNLQLTKGQVNQQINQLSPQQVVRQQLSPQEFIQQSQLSLQHLRQENQLQQINQRQKSSTNQPNQLNQSAQFQILPTQPTFDSNFSANTTSVQINNSSSNIQTNLSNDGNLDSALTSFLGSVDNNQNNSSACNNFLAKSTTNILNNSSPTNFSSQLKNNSTANQLPATYCDLQLLENNLNINQNTNLNSNSNLPTTSQIENPFFDHQNQVFCSKPSRQYNCDSSTMLKSDTLNNSTLLSSNLNCYVNQINFLNQTNQLSNQLVNSSQLLNNQNNFTNSSNFQSQSQSNQQNTIINSPIKNLNSSQFKTSLINNNLSKIRSPSNEWLDTIANRVSNDMKGCGICVIDNFLGSSFCDIILKEVVEMYSDGFFKDGLLVGKKQSGDKNIRGDEIHWVNGTEGNCQNIGYLMRTLDQILLRFSRLNTDGCKSILNRTKAMIACYPAKGTKYVKHVDNPNEDGRYITCIYYLNKNWNSLRDGGTLRIFPKDLPYVANIEPLFDRVIFFWSDRRNPHEVMPAYSIRFAITLWYFNSKEREQYIKRMQQQQQSNLEIS